MNKLILVGNGFDLAHGLKTSYSDFILWHLNKTLKKFIASNPKYYEGELVTFDQGRFFINKNEFSSINDFQSVIKNQQLNIVYKNEFIKDIISDSILNNWVDIESKYYNHIVRIYKSFAVNNFLNRGHYLALLKELNKYFNIIKIELSEYLLTVDNKLKDRNKEIDLHFLGELNTDKGINKGMERNNILVLNFNYTSTVEVYKYVKTNFTINYIHGKLGDSNNPIIFGYGDEMHEYYEKIEQLDSNDFLMNIKSFNYFKTNNYQDFIKYIDSDLFEVSIMGHSCGLSDRILLNSIFEHKNCMNINIYYHQKNNSDDDYFEKTQQISRHFKANFKGEMRKKIISHKYSKPLINFK